LGFGQIAPTGGPCRAPQEGSPEDSFILMAEPAGAAGGVPQAPAQLWGQVDSGLVHGTILVPYGDVNSGGRRSIRLAPRRVPLELSQARLKIGS